MLKQIPMGKVPTKTPASSFLKPTPSLPSHLYHLTMTPKEVNNAANVIFFLSQRGKRDSFHVPHPFAFQIFPSAARTHKCHLLILHSYYRPSLHLIRSLRFSTHSLMVPELEKPRVTEIQVRMDCNGCVQKIKKALHGINGIYDLYIDFPQQKLTVIGWADPEKIIKAIRKTRKIATICSHTEPPDPAAQTAEKPPEQAPEGGAPPPPAFEQANPPAAEAPPAETAAEPPKDPPQPENPPPPGGNPSPSPVAEETSARQPEKPPGPKDVGEVHVIYHHPPDFGHRYAYGHNYGGNWTRHPISQAVPQAAPKPVYVTHSYNTYRPPPNVTEYEYLRPPSHHSTIYSRMDHYDEDYHDNSRSSNGNITSMFSDENPNACRIM